MSAEPKESGFEKPGDGRNGGGGTLAAGDLAPETASPRPALPGSAAALARLPLAELRVRAAVLALIIRGAQAEGDLRWEGLIPDQRALNAAIVAREREARAARGEPEPEAVVVRMKTAESIGRCPAVSGGTEDADNGRG